MFMRRIPVTLIIVASAFNGVAAAAQSSNEAGYRDCDLKHLQACQNSNQLFSGPPGTSTPKRDFSDALSAFLSNAPEYRTGGYTFSAATVAQESLIGPGGAPVRFSSGELFFDGFTPHYALDRGAVIFDPLGNIVLVATFNTADIADASRHVLRIYAHNTEPSPELTKRVQDWAESAVEDLNSYPGLPTNTLVGTQLLVARGDPRQWQSRSLP
jgi:hypothetical protein